MKALRLLAPLTALLAAAASLPAQEAVAQEAVAPVQQPAMGGNDAGGWWLNDASLNEVLGFLAREAGKQYFHNAAIEGPAFRVTGHLNDGDPETQMEEVAFMYGLDLFRKGNTIYAFSPAQVNQLPQEELAYQLRYLRPTDIDQIINIINPLLTPGSGLVNFESKTNTILVIDSAKRLASVANILEKLDKPKGQIIVEVKILRVTSITGSRIGVDWSSVLGEEGLPLEASQNLNALFNLPTVNTAERVITNTSITGAEGASSFNSTFGPGTASTTRERSGSSTFNNGSETIETLTRFLPQGSGLVLSPLEVRAVLRALNSGNLASQKSNPTVITEDNEVATVSIIDRVPIITTTSTQNTAGGNPTVTEEVRYRIDESDPVGDPRTTREIGVTLAVTPTLLPDDTIRMALRPRTAQIIEFIQGPQTNNLYPRVSEATIETMARVPNGYSLLIGGFYDERERDRENKVPLLGDIPILNFFFRNKEKSSEQTSLVFVITPTSYEPAAPIQTLNVTDQLMDRIDLREGFDQINPNVPGRAHTPNLRRTMRAILDDQLSPLRDDIRLPRDPQPAAIPPVANPPAQTRWTPKSPPPGSYTPEAAPAPPPPAPQPRQSPSPSPGAAPNPLFR